MPITYENATPLQIAQFEHAMTYLANAPKVRDILAKSVFQDLVIVFNSNENNSQLGNKVYWDPNVTLNVRQADGSIGAQSPALGLLHELYHWFQGGSATGSYTEWMNLQDEIAAANFLGEPVRLTYTSTYTANLRTLVSNPTAHAKSGYWKALDPNGVEVQTAQSFDPDAPAVIVIGEQPSGSGGGEGTGGGSTYGGSGSSGGGAGGGGTGTVVVQPVPDPKPEENPEIVVDPYPVDLSHAPEPVSIVGLPDPVY